MSHSPESCPKCSADLRGPLIWDHFFAETKNEEEAYRISEAYGADRHSGRFGKAIGLYDRDRDMTVSWMCPECEHKWARL